MSTNLFSYITNETELEYVQCLSELKTELENGEEITYEYIESLAFNVLNLDGDNEQIFISSLWTEDFIKMIVHRIDAYDPHWSLLLVAIGNTVASPCPILMKRMVKNSVLLELLNQFLCGNITQSKSVTEIEKTVQDCAAWIISSFVQCIENEIPDECLSFVPGLLMHLTNVNPDSPNKQLFTPCFRSLCAIFSVAANRKLYPNEYSSFSNIVKDHTLLLSLREELDCGLLGKPLPRTTYYPDAFNRLLTVQYLAENPEFRRVLVEMNFLPLLIASLTTIFEKSQNETFLLWSRAVRSLHKIVSSKEYYSLLNNPVLKNNLAALAVGRYLEISTFPILQLISYPMKMRRQSADMIVTLGMKWEIQRLFWIGIVKPQSKLCFLRNLPKELIRRIMIWFALLGGFYDPNNCSLGVVRLGYKD